MYLNILNKVNSSIVMIYLCSIQIILFGTALKQLEISLCFNLVDQVRLLIVMCHFAFIEHALGLRY